MECCCLLLCFHNILVLLQPNDIQAAESGGALAVGVCTGIFKKEELEQASIGGAVILPSLAVCESFLNLLNL